ncbi:putative DNA-binding pseudobarrel domain superfamily [Helianthus annuus]|nr:putative DNA-binding pseudobarrel domain superfamily [Helianthus annuus]
MLIRTCCIGVGKLKKSFKVYVNQWDSFDVLIHPDPLRNCYFITDGWDKIVRYMDLLTGVVLVLRYVANYTFQLTVFNLNGCEIIVTKADDSLKGDTSSHKFQLAEIAKDMDHRSDVEESSDEDFDSDCVVSDESSDDGGDEDFVVMVSDYEADPNYHPIEFVWDYQQRFHLNAKVPSMARIDMSLKMTVQNLNGVDTIVNFRPEKHGKGFRYVAWEWTKKFTKPDRIHRNMKCKFVYSPDKAKLILEKVYK